MASSKKSEAIDPRLLQLSPDDNVGVAKRLLEAGESVILCSVTVVLETRIPTGHKLALVPIAAGEKVLKHGAPIGSATADIGPGQYVHTHNVKSDYLPTYARGKSATL